MPAIGRGHHVRDVGPGELGDRAHAGELHLLVDRGRAHVERTPEDEREAQDVVDLVRIVRAAGGDDAVGPDLLGELGPDLRVGVGHGQDDRPVGHLRHHLGLEHARHRQAEEHVGTRHDLGQRAGARVLGVALLLRVHRFGAAAIDHALAVGDPDVLAPHAQADHDVQAGDGGGPGARADQLDVLDPLADHLERVEQGRGRHDRRAVLVVVEHRDLHPLAQPGLDQEALGRLDVLEIDPAEGGLERGDGLDQLVRVGLGDLDVEHVDPGELLEQAALALHHRLAGDRADVAEAQDRRAVGDHRHQVALGGVVVGQQRVLLDLQARHRHPRTVGQREVALVAHALGRRDRDLARRRIAMIVERRLIQLVVHQVPPRSVAALVARAGQCPALPHT